MKYYYNDQLIRTSNRQYRYALVLQKEEGYKALMCSKDRINCCNELRKRLGRVYEALGYHKECVRVYEQGGYGKTLISEKDYNFSKELVECGYRDIDMYNNRCQVVELEVR